jgi:oligopeptidase A
MAINPLLDHSGLPRFDSIQTQDVLPALEKTLSDNRKTIAQIEDQETPTWENFVAPLEDIDERLDRMWSPVSHLNAVMDSADLREAYEQGIEQLTGYSNEVSQNTKLYQAFEKLRQSPAYSGLSDAQKRIVDNNIRDFKLSGVALNASDKKRFAEISIALSELSNKFSRNTLDATQAWSKLITQESELKGLPATAIELARQSAKANDQNGWLFTLQFPSYIAVMQHAGNSALRKEVYEAYSMKASELGEHAGQFDNGKLIPEILQLRHEKAKLLGFQNYAELSLQTKMANSTQEVVDFLKQLADYAKPIAEKELAELTEFALQEFGVDELKPWDISYYSERLREARYDISDELVKPYFPVQQVFSGLFEIVSRLFQIQIKANRDMVTWHDDVKCFDVFDEKGEPIGQLYADLYARESKRGGAWMGTCVNRRETSSGTQNPVAFLVCNFTPPIGKDPALLSHDEVETLFHEFGHTLHHLLTKVSEYSVAGINGVEWDAVELPSQFLENWCWQAEGLELIARHYETGEALPNELLEKMRAAKNFQSGMQTVRQLEFALFDINLHAGDNFKVSSSDVQKQLDQVRDQVAVIKPPSTNRFQNSFGHIFAGGYAAGYYSYKWSEVLSSDAFSRFEEDGILNQQTGAEFKQNILEQGGVYDAKELFNKFRKREADIQPLLRHTGLLQ